MARGLLAAGFNYSMVAEDEFNDWYDTEHIPERSRVPGFINCVRWVGVEDPKVSIATYDLDRREVLYSDAYKAIGRENLSPWSKRMVGRCQRLLRIEGDQLIPGNETMRGTTQNLMVFACNVKPEIEAEVKQWYGEEHIPRLLKVPGVASARFFESQTGTHKFIALYEIEKPEACASDAWKEAAFTPWTNKMRPQLADVLRVVLRRYQRKAA